MKIYLKENQFKNLVEARMDGFRVDYLTNCNTFKEMAKYCEEMLGFPIGEGSSRIIFQLDDETCLKLAKNFIGIAQNKEEMAVWFNHNKPYIPKVYNGTDEKHAIWIVAEYVIPATEEDFYKVAHVNFDDIVNFTCYLDNYICSGGKTCYRIMLYKIVDKYEKNAMATELLTNICDFKSTYNQYVGDLGKIENWGLARRNGRTVFVMLDTGLSQNVFNRFYNVR